MTLYQQLTGGFQRNILAAGNSRESIQVASDAPFIGETMDEVSFYLKKVGSPTGNITSYVRNSSDTIVATLGTQSITYPSSHQSTNSDRKLQVHRH